MMDAIADASNSDATLQLVNQAMHGDDRAWDALFTPHRDRLRRMVAVRLDHRLRGRVDPSDVIQESALDAARRLPELADVSLNSVRITSLGPRVSPIHNPAIESAGAARTTSSWFPFTTLSGIGETRKSRSTPRPRGSGFQ